MADLDGVALASDVSFEDAGEALGCDLRLALETALDGGAVHDSGIDPLTVFRAGLADSIGRIQRHKRAELFMQFLRDGPYDRPGRFLLQHAGNCLRDTETARVLRFLCGHIVSSFQGFLAEVLAAGALARWLEAERRAGRIPAEAQLYLGDSVTARQLTTERCAKAADAHVLSLHDSRQSVTVHAVAEVKSYRPRPAMARAQFSSHLTRARQGLIVSKQEIAGRRVNVDRAVKRVLVTPSAWLLPRTFRYEPTPTGHRLFVDEGEPPGPADEVVQVGSCDIHISLRWSREALASVAYDMSHWFMGRVGETVWAESSPPWLKMTPGDAGRNAAKQMLYYALLRVSRKDDWDKAVALYNSYGFGYALGMSFRDTRGGRQMLWPEDLEAISAHGKTEAIRSKMTGKLLRRECRIAGAFCPVSV